MTGQDPKTTRSFPTAEQIRGMTDVDQLQKEIDYTTTQISLIRANLEFPRMDDNGTIDPSWDSRARGALAHGMTALSHMERQMRSLARSKEIAVSKGMMDAARAHEELVKIEKQKVILEQEKNNIARDEVANERNRIKLENRRITKTAEMIRRMSWERCFVDVAKNRLPPEQWQEIVDIVEKKMETRVSQVLAQPQSQDDIDENENE